MDPKFVYRAEHIGMCLFFGLASTAPLAGSDALILTQARGLPELGSWACSAPESELVWRSSETTSRGLSAGFVAACEPAVDFKGRTLYFSGRRTLDETFRIWQLDLVSNEISPLTREGSDARHPLVLPSGGVAYLRDGDVFRHQVDLGADEQLTFTRGQLRSAAMLADGRLLLLEGTPGGGRLFTALPDGTWSTLWPGLDGIAVRDFAIMDGERLLILADNSELLLVSVMDPYAPIERLPVDIEGSVERLARGTDASALLVKRFEGRLDSGANEVISLHLNPEPAVLTLTPQLGRAVLEATSAEPASLPASLPSIVKPEMTTGYLVVLDVGRSDDPGLQGLTRDAVAEVRVLEFEDDRERVLASVDPAEDGSVYLEVPADTPLALQLIDGQGEIVARTHTSIWVRPNERRGCLGCHVSPAYAPPNVRPQAILREPQRALQSSEVSP